MVPRLWVPLTHWLWARNWNLAASGACLTASRVANRVAVSTPLRIESSTWAAVSVVVILVPPCRGCLLVAGILAVSPTGWRAWVIFRVRGGWSGGLKHALARGRPGGQRRRLLVDGGAQLLLQLGERRYRRVGRELAGDPEDLPQRPLALLLVARERGGILGAGAERVVEGGRQQFGIAERVTDAVGGDRVAVVSGVPDQGPAWAERLAQLVGLPEHAPHRRGLAGVTQPLDQLRGHARQQLAERLHA